MVGAATRRGLIQPVTPGQARTWIDDPTLSASPRPLWLIVTAHDDPTAVGDSVAWQSRTLTVLAKTAVRVQGSAIAQQLLARE